jgi:hypothetical protein
VISHYPMQYDKRWLAWCGLLMTALTAVLYWVIPYQGHWEVDSGCYEQIARWMLGQETLTRMPWSMYYGYSGMLALIYKVCGHQVWAVVIAQLVLSLCIMMIAYRIGYLLSGMFTARIAAALTACNLGVLFYSQLVMTEIPVALLLLLGIERLLAALHETDLVAQRKLWGWSGFFFGCSIWVKPAALLFAPVVIVFAAMCGGAGWRNRLINAAYFATGFYIPVALYSLINMYVCGFFGVQIIGTNNIYLYFLSKLIASVDGISPEIAMKNLLNLLPSDQYPLEPHYWDAVHAVCVHYVATHPWLAVKIWLFNVGKTMFGLFTTQLKVMLSPTLAPGALSITKIVGPWWAKPLTYITGGATSSWVVLLGVLDALWSCVRWVLLALGALYIVSQRAWRDSAAIFLFTMYFLMVTGHDGSGRYRMMVEPLLVVLTAVGVHVLVLWYRQRTKASMNSERAHVNS